MRPVRDIKRRSFLKKAAGAAVGAMGLPYIVSAAALGKASSVAASERIVMGFIGTGGRGGSLLRNFMHLPDAQVVAVCDVKRQNRDRALQTVDKHYGKKVCKAYNDFRSLCGRSDIDAVVVASTDHWHVLHALTAVRAAKDVYCEKPLGMSVEQGQVLRQEVNRYGRVFQFGTQERSSRNSRFACEMVRSGRVGKIHKITVASRYSRASEDYPPMPVPDWLDYDLWLGAAPWAPYTANRVNNSHWFHISDYALGFMAGCGIHTIDIATWGNGTDLTGPVEVEGTGEFPRDGLCNCATGWDVNLKFANGVTMNFTDGQRNPLGVRFEGMDGWVFVKEEHLGGKVDAHPKSLLSKVIGPDEVHLPVSDHHQQNFLDCVKTRARTVAPVEVAVRSDTLCQLSDIAMRLGRKLRWDPEKEKFINDAQANRMLTRPMRSPWRL
ncbi:MAG: Gfo/Idh/MocA family protein [Planctomycetota bacterium]|jgi:predicted dehydrogenase